MERKQRSYDKGYKIQAVKLSKEIGSSRAAKKLGIPADTLYGWAKAAREVRYWARRAYAGIGTEPGGGGDCITQTGQITGKRDTSTERGERIFSGGERFFSASRRKPP